MIHQRERGIAERLRRLPRHEVIAGDFDQRRFPDPFTFDIRRTPNEHLAFGLKSPHKCLGEHLARVEIKVLFEELLPRLADIRLNGQVQRLRSNFISGIKHLPVTFTPES